MPADRLAKVKAALPKVAWPRLQEILLSPQTFWYDHESMKPSYQVSIQGGSLPDQLFANSNDKWAESVADQPRRQARQFLYDEAKKRWRFPFATTAGTDDATNLKVVNFLWLPAKDGKILPVTHFTTRKTEGGSPFYSSAWGWLYPNGAVVGELIFVTTSSGEMLASEIRTRTRYASGWATNVFRPFPTAASLATAIKERRASWQSDEKLRALVAHLENNDNVRPKSLRSALPGLYNDDGSEDILPDFGDAELVRSLLRETSFESSYSRAWKVPTSGKPAYAPTTTASFSIVPTNYTGGMFEVNEASCTRCHNNAGRRLTTFDRQRLDGFDGSSLSLYGEMWGRDSVFSFHPFDESTYPRANFRGDNRRQNPRLVAQGLIANYDKNAHIAPVYPTKETGLGEAPSTSAPGSGSGSTPPLAEQPGNGGNSGGNNSSGSGSTGNVVEFRIPAGTGRGDWNTQSNPVVVKAGQTVRITNDDSTGHILHSNDDDVCKHGDVSRPVRQGQSFECQVSSRAQKKTYLFWDHQFGGPSSSRFYIRVE